MKVSVEERRWHRVRKQALLLAVGSIALGLMAGLFTHESIKGRGVTMTSDREAVAAEREEEARTAGYPSAGAGEGVTRVPPIDASQPQKIETATFALG